MFANSQKLLQKSIFVNVVVQGHAIFAKKKEKKNYYLKINVPKVTMLCKWPLIYVWILAIPLFYPFEYWLLGSEYPDSDLPLLHFGLFSPLAKGTNQAVSGKKPLTKPKPKDSEFFFPSRCLPNSVYLDICLALGSLKRVKERLLLFWRLLWWKMKRVMGLDRQEYRRVFAGWGHLKWKATY